MEYPKLRRANRQLSEEETVRILMEGAYGVLSTVGGNGMPYGVPLSYVFEDGCIYFHCAIKGHKLQNMRFEPRVSFTVVTKADAVYAGSFTVHYESAVAFGTAFQVADRTLKLEVLEKISRKYLPEQMGKFDDEANQYIDVTGIWGIRIEHMTGKANR